MKKTCLMLAGLTAFCAIGFCAVSFCAASAAPTGTLSFDEVQFAQRALTSAQISASYLAALNRFQPNTFTSANKHEKSATAPWHSIDPVNFGADGSVEVTPTEGPQSVPLTAKQGE